MVSLCARSVRLRGLHLILREHPPDEVVDRLAFGQLLIDAISVHERFNYIFPILLSGTPNFPGYRSVQSMVLQ